MSMLCTYSSEFKTGDRVIIGGDIHASVEELIFCRNMKGVLLLCEWFQNGELRSARVHSDDAKKVAA